MTETATHHPPRFLVQSSKRWEEQSTDEKRRDSEIAACIQRIKSLEGRMDAIERKKP